MIGNIVLQFAASFFGTIAFSIMFYVPRRYYPCCGLIGGLGWITCWGIMNIFGMSNFTGTFVAASLVVLLSRICGVRLKCPATLFMLSGLFPLVPGVGIYWTVYSMIMGELVEASRYGRQTFGTAIAIVLGICLVFEIPQKWIAKLAQLSLQRHYFLLLIVLLFFVGCRAEDTNHQKEKGKLRDATPQVLETKVAEEKGTDDAIVTLDLSHQSDGYLGLIYWGDNEKVKFQIAAPDQVTYTYLIPEPGRTLVLPLSGGDGQYDFTLLESVDIENDRYAIVDTQSAQVTLSDGFLPFLAPNLYVNYTSDSQVVAKGEELAEECYGDLDVIEKIYDYVTQTITYDNEKATTVSYGYIPNPDETLETKKGICFDYAALISAMLRSQRIPTKLEVGYVGEAYHAWISCYTKETGWVDDLIEFDGKNWSLMDPTLAANHSASELKKYIGDGSNYMVKYTY